MPVAVLTGLAFAAPIQAFAATQRNDSAFASLFRFVIMPMFIFSGTFFPISQLPELLQVVARPHPVVARRGPRARHRPRRPRPSPGGGERRLPRRLRRRRPALVVPDLQSEAHGVAACSSRLASRPARWVAGAPTRCSSATCWSTGATGRSSCRASSSRSSTCSASASGWARSSATSATSRTRPSWPRDSWPRPP